MSESIWKKEISLELLNSFSSQTMVEQIGIRYTEITDSTISAEMPVDARTHQPLGLLHGGASAALIETLASVGATWAGGPNQYCGGVEINANHLRAVRSGVVTGTASPLHRGSSIQVWQVDIHDSASRLVCTGRLTLAVMSQDRS